MGPVPKVSSLYDDHNANCIYLGNRSLFWFPHNTLYGFLDRCIFFLVFLLQVLQERGESTSRHGRATFSVLLFQVAVWSRKLCWSWLLWNGCMVKTPVLNGLLPIDLGPGGRKFEARGYIPCALPSCGPGLRPREVAIASRPLLIPFDFFLEMVKTLWFLHNNHTWLKTCYHVTSIFSILDA